MRSTAQCYNIRDRSFKLNIYSRMIWTTMITRSTMPKREIINIRDRSLNIYYSRMIWTTLITRSTTSMPKREIINTTRDRSLNIYSRMIWTTMITRSTMPKREIINIRDSPKIIEHVLTDQLADLYVDDQDDSTREHYESVKSLISDPWQPYTHRLNVNSLISETALRSTYTH
jgi:hypothetical protein